MHNVLKALLKKLAVAVFPGAALDMDSFPRQELYDRYRKAFEYGGDPQTTVIIDGFMGKVFVANDFEQLYRNLGRFEHGIQMVLRLPTDTWGEIRGDIEVQDLTVAKAA